MEQALKIYLNQLEIDGTVSDSPETARKQIATFLQHHSGLPKENGTTISDHMEAICKSDMVSREVALHILRWLNIEGLLPDSNKENQRDRKICEIVEKALPDFAKEYGLKNHRLTHEKIIFIKQIHENIIRKFDVFKNLPRDPEELEGAKQNIYRTLNNGMVKSYFNNENIDKVNNGIHTIFEKLSEIKEFSPNTFSDDVDGSRKYINEQLQYSDNNYSLIVSIAYQPFLLTAQNIVETIVETSKRKFVTNVEQRIPGSGRLQKRHPLHEAGRTFVIRIPFRNSGPGNALNSKASLIPSDDDVEITNAVELGDVAPGNFSLFVDAKVISPCAEFSCLLEFIWLEAGKVEEKSITCEFTVEAQQTDINWEELEYKGPYSTSVAKGSAFVGRKERVVGLANQLLRDPIESFYITGQKRVGKTSLALAAAEFAKRFERGNDIVYHYILWGDIAYKDPEASLQAFGKSVADFLISNLPSGITPTEPVFEGSLAPLIQLSRTIHDALPTKKFTILFDEFDEIHPDLYRYGELAETFFANLRAFSTCENIGIILIGGENMPFVLDRQGQKLNKFVRERLDYYTRDEEWADYEELIRQPTMDHLTWQDDAIVEVFNCTNGNPYFTKIICGSVFANSVEERDADITAHEVQRAIAKEVVSFDTNSFMHLWQDGAFSFDDSAKLEILQRRRVLVAIARTVRKNQANTIENILANKHSAELSESQLYAVLENFCRRGILIEREGAYSFLLPIFETWLVQGGLNLLVADSLGDELAEDAQRQEDAAYVNLEEIAAVQNNWPIYRGQEVSLEDVRLWLNQVPSQRDQRLLFKLLKGIKIYSDADIREKLKTAHTLVLQYVPQFIQRRLHHQRSDIVVSYVDGEGKSGQIYAAKYAEENNIPRTAIISPESFTEKIENYEASTGGDVHAVVIVDDIIATGQSMLENVTPFINNNKKFLLENNLPVILIAITATVEGEEAVRQGLDKLAYDKIALRVCEPLERRLEAFDAESPIWENEDERYRAKALVEEYGTKVYKDNPLGFGGKALLIVFPETVPNNCLPILHTSSRSEPRWKPLFSRVVN